MLLGLVQAEIAPNPFFDGSLTLEDASFILVADLHRILNRCGQLCKGQVEAEIVTHISLKFCQYTQPLLVSIECLEVAQQPSVMLDKRRRPIHPMTLLEPFPN